MKSILLAAAAMIAVPAIAQEQPAGTAGQTAPGTATQGADTMSTTADPTADAPPAAQTPPTDQAAPVAQTPPAGTTGAAPSGSMGSTGGMAPSTGMASGDPAAADPAGGYQPSTPPMQGTPAPGATVRFQAAPDPNTAFPPPPPMQKYPVCKKGQYDNCIQRGGK